jgi:DNA-binding response OmpR family regulator
MSVSLFRPLPTGADRLPGCSHSCQRRRYFNEDTGGLYWATDHDPATHEQYGAAWALHRDSHLVFRTGPFEFDGRRNRGAVHGQPVSFTPRESEILIFLGRNLGQVVPYRDIMAEVFQDPNCRFHARGKYEGQSAGWHLINVNITRIRKKLGPAARLLVTRKPIGLELIAEEPVP